MKRYIIFVLAVVFSVVAVGQTATPEITQIIVNEMGGVTLFWDTHAAESDFDHSEVWYKQSYLPEFNKIPTSENFYHLLNHFIYPEAQANSRLTSYYVANYNKDDVSVALNSEVVKAIYLSACFSTEKIQLSWNRMHLSWTEHAFYIYRKAGNNSNWHFLDSTYNTNYLDTPEPYYRDYSYRVFYKNPSNPTASVSNITYPISHSAHQPISPCITAVAMHSDGTTAIEWEKSPSTNVVDYIIYLKKDNDTWKELDKTGSPDILEWLDQTTSEDCEKTRTYAIAAINDCGETGANYPDSSKSILVLHAPEYDICTNSIKLSWQPCENMRVDRYEILFSENGDDNFAKYAEVAANDTAYSCADLTANYGCFKVSAVHERGHGKKPQTITSCQYCMEILHQGKPEASAFRYISVMGNTIEICCEVDTNAYLPKYQIERSETGMNGTYEVIATLEPNGTTMICTVDADLTLKTQKTSYHYLLNTLDGCGNVFPVKNPSQSILLTATETEEHHATLEWNDYDGYLLGLDHYIIYRYINNEIDATFSIITTSTYFDDTDPQLTDQTLTVAYRVAAVSRRNAVNPCDTAFSNIAPLKRLKNDIWFPNAFSPMGGNKVFRPVYSGLDVEVYEFTIFDRYGAAIYQTNEPGGGWNGRINGAIASVGGYGYMLKIKLKNGDRIERRGSMILVN